MSSLAPSLDARRPLLVLDEAAHVYTHRDGHRPPGVTKILGAVEPWRSLFARADPERVAYKGDLGRQVHLAALYYDEDALDPMSVDPVVLPYLDAWRRFRVEKGFVPQVMETRVYHAMYDYAGTLDRIGVVDGAVVMADIKTGDGSMAGPQTAGYLEAWRSMDPAGCGLVQRWSVQLKPDGHYAITTHTNRRDWRIFLAALELWHFNRSLHP